MRDSKVRESQKVEEDKGGIQRARAQAMGLPCCWRASRRNVYVDAVGCGGQTSSQVWGEEMQGQKKIHSLRVGEQAEWIR